MANFTMAVSGGEVAVQDKTLVASTPDVITLDEPLSAIEVLSDGTAAIYFSVDGTTPAVGNAHCFKIPAAGSQPCSLVVSGLEPVVKVQVFSTGTPVYSVQRAA